MKARYILELDPLASIESNLEFLKKCERDIQGRRDRLKKLAKTPKNQMDLEDNIKEIEKEQ